MPVLNCKFGCHLQALSLRHVTSRRAPLFLINAIGKTRPPLSVVEWLTSNRNVRYVCKFGRPQMYVTCSGVLNDVAETNIGGLATPVAIRSVMYDPSSWMLIYNITILITEQLFTEMLTHLYYFHMVQRLLQCREYFVRTTRGQMSAGRVALDAQ